jgi:hypothetical protein
MSLYQDEEKTVRMSPSDMKKPRKPRVDFRGSLRPAAGNRRLSDPVARILRATAPENVYSILAIAPATRSMLRELSAATQMRPVSSA